MNAAVFIEPDGALRDAIVAGKAWVARHVGAAPYLIDPPHCTIVAGTYRSVDAVGTALRDAVATIQPFVLRTRGTAVFQGDALARTAEGGTRDTIAFGVEPMPELFALQRSVAEALSSFVAHDPNSFPPFADDVLTRSVARFGWPFVGAHWIPHFTLAALPAGTTGTIPRELLSAGDRLTLPVGAISLWEIDRRCHRRRAIFPLSAPPA